ncbi:MAG: hypothetical protein IJ042_05920 [Butyricicoccus sp.]|nr:hypothetical protein [Butyricicoccus sp.]
MTSWNAKYTNEYGEYEITFRSTERETAKAVEKVCCAAMDGIVKKPEDVFVLSDILSAGRKKDEPDACAKIQMLLGAPEILAQLAEECTELSHAALKLRRAMTGVNPTPISAADAMADLLEEIADVFAALEALGVHTDEYEETVCRIWDEKLARWVERLENGCEHEEH